MSKIINEIKKTIKNSNIKPIIVFPEGHNKFIEKAAINLKNNSKILPLLVVKKDSKIKNNGLKYISIESFEHKENLIENLYQIRKSKGLSKKEATNLIEKSNYFATMLVKIGKAHGYVGGIEYTTADTLRPALQIIKTNPNSKIVSSLFIMEKNEEQFLFADCAINLNPNIEQIVEITKQVNNFGLNIVKMNEVRNALLSYSTAGSAKGEDAIKMEKAYEILKKEDLKNQKVFGSIQFDAAFVKSIMNKKAPNLKWNDKANSFIFPNLSSGNIGYKIAERLANYSAIGPILLGLASPINDLSRGALVEDIINVTYITVAQIIDLKKEKLNEKTISN